jgi:SAM-dependent methyltransferase
VTEEGHADPAYLEEMGFDEEEWARRRGSFGDEADNYAIGRPHYPREALEWGLPPGARVAVDLGAGTGLLTEGLLDLGLNVTAIEPSDGMRAHIPSTATAVAASAESLPIPDASVDAVFVGQAWHWFDIPAALAEVARVLRPGGTLTLLWNLLDTSDPTTLLLADLIKAEERADQAPDELRAPFEPNSDFPDPRQRVVRHTERYDVERAVAYALSRSSAIIMAEADREGMTRRLRVGLPAGEFDVHLQTECWRSERAGS